MQINSIIGTKTYQKQGFLQDGTRVPLTGVQTSGNVITQIKKSDKEGYNALQIGFGINKKAKKQTEGHAKKAGLENTPRFFREIEVLDLEGASLGSKLNVSEIFAPGDVIDVTGTSKGKGWAGGVKRWGFKGGPRTHGQSDRERAPGSIGQTTTPGRVYKGKKMAGRMGSDTVTIRNLEVIEITNDGILLIKGLVPGSLNTILTIKKVGENKKFVPLYKNSAEQNSEEPVAEEAQIAEVNKEDGADSPPVSDDAQQEAGRGQSVSSDVQESEESKASNSPSLSDSSVNESSQNQGLSAEPAVGSAEDGQPFPAQNQEEKSENEEDK